MEKIRSLSRRKLLAAGAAGAVITAASAAGAASFGNPDQPAEGAVNVTNPKALVPLAQLLRPLALLSWSRSMRAFAASA